MITCANKGWGRDASRPSEIYSDCVHQELTMNYKL